MSDELNLVISILCNEINHLKERIKQEKIVLSTMSVSNPNYQRFRGYLKSYENRLWEAEKMFVIFKRLVRKNEKQP